MTLADRLNKIIDEQGLTKRAFAKTLGVSENYIYQLTGSQEKLTTISETLAKLIALEFGYDKDKIGIMGSSAGGHLASTAATHFNDNCRPDFQILFYPVISMDISICHKGSRERLIGKNPTEELIRLYSNELQVTEHTPPAFIMHSSDDRTVPVENSIRYYQALIKNKIPVSLHCYPIGGHGWGYNDSFKYKRQWTGELEKWLQEL